MRATTFVEECKRSAALNASVHAFRNHYATEIGQTAVCHHFHPLMKRVCRWLLVCADCARSETIELTQDRLAQMLGASRDQSPEWQRGFRGSGANRQRHGRIHIANRSGLAARAC